MAKTKYRFLYLVSWYNENNNYTEFTELYSTLEGAEAAAMKYEATYPPESGIKFVVEQVEFIK